MFDFLKNIGPTELIVLLAIVVLFFGSRIAVGIGKASGQSLKEIKHMIGEITGSSGESKNKSEE